MKVESLSVEEMCRRLLRVAVNAELVGELATSPEMVLSGEIVGMANLLSGYLRDRNDIPSGK